MIYASSSSALMSRLPVSAIHEVSEHVRGTKFWYGGGTGDNQCPKARS